MSGVHGSYSRTVGVAVQVMLAKFRTERCAVKQILCETKGEYRASMQEMLLMQVRLAGFLVLRRDSRFNVIATLFATAWPSRTAVPRRSRGR